MPECKYCGLQIQFGASCIGVTDNRIRYGLEHRFVDYPPVDNCPDCYVSLGGYHHLYCDQEECSHCGGQAVRCRCSTVSQK